MSDRSGTDVQDRQEIIDHIHALFRAFQRCDREAVRNGHTKDWVGFQIKSENIVRGIDEYMKNAEVVLTGMPFKRYEIVDTEVKFYGEVAVVYYVAREWYDDETGKEQTIVFRSLDIYRHEEGGWNQCGSNICVVPGQ